MRKFLAMFPLQVVAFPGERLHLHIFEPRYRQLIQECRDEGKGFGIPPYINGGVSEFGTEMALVEVVKTYEDGEMDIITEGVCAFHLESFEKEAPGKLYAGGEVTLLENDPATSDATINALRERYHALHKRLGTGVLRENWARPNLSFYLADETGLTFGQRIHLLSLGSEDQRQQYLIEHIDRVLPLLDAAEETRSHIKGNGRFRKYPELKL